MKTTDDKALQCDGNLCTKIYTVKDEHFATVETYLQEKMTKDGGANIGFEPFNVDMQNPDGDYTKNSIDLWYYKDPVFSAGISNSFAYSNEEKPILIETDFFWSDGD